jgi:hypothetical protein
LRIFILCFLIQYSFVEIARLDTLSGLIYSHWQFLDIDLLKSKPLESIFYLHSQPPLLNILTALIVSSGAKLYDTFVLVNALASAFTAYVIFTIIGYYFNKKIGIILAVAYSVFPATLLNVAYPFYPCLTAFGASLFIYGIFCANENTTRSLVLSGLAIVYLVMLRSSFSVIHVAALLVIILYANWGKLSLRSSLILTIVVASLSVAVPIKNYIVFGFFGTTSWSPLNLAKGFNIPLEQGYFPNPEELKAKGIDCKKNMPAVAALQQTEKSNGQENYNSCYILTYSSNATEVVKENYSIFVHAKKIAHHVFYYFNVPDKYFFLTNRAAITSYANAWSIAQGSITVAGLELPRIFVIIAILLFLYRFTFVDKFTLSIVVFLGMHFLTHILTDGDEGQRFVYDIEFIFFIMYGFLFGNYLVKKNKYAKGF